jgi:hypothetical protein
VYLLAVCRVNFGAENVLPAMEQKDKPVEYIPYKLI